MNIDCLCPCRSLCKSCSVVALKPKLGCVVHSRFDSVGPGSQTSNHRTVPRTIGDLWYSLFLSLCVFLFSDCFSDQLYAMLWLTCGYPPHDYIKMPPMEGFPYEDRCFSYRGKNKSVFDLSGPQNDAGSWTVIQTTLIEFPWTAKKKS